MKRPSGSSGDGGSNNSSNNGTINSQASSLPQTNVSTSSVGITSGVQHGIAITGGGNNDNSGSGFSSNTSLRKSTIATKEQQQQQQSISKKKQLNGKEIEELAAGLRKLNLKKENSLIEQFIAGKIFSSLLIFYILFFQLRSIPSSFILFINDMIFNINYLMNFKCILITIIFLFCFKNVRFEFYYY